MYDYYTYIKSHSYKINIFIRNFSDHQLLFPTKNKERVKFCASVQINDSSPQQ